VTYGAISNEHKKKEREQSQRKKGQIKKEMHKRRGVDIDGRG
jgi:hypothetical protein